MTLQIILMIFGLLIFITLFINLKAKKAYPNVDSQIRTAGYLATRALRIKTEDGFIKSTERDQKNTFTYRLPRNITSREVTITSNNNRKIPMIIFQSIDSKPNATGLLYIHGGGYAMGNPDSQPELNLLFEFINTTNTIAFVPAYTKSLTAPYPAALEDCYHTLLWMKNNASDLEINPSQLFTCGISAGGGLTAALSLYARDLKQVNIAFQMPLYPMLDDRMQFPSAQNNHNILWDSKKNYYGWKYYLGNLFENENVPCYASPTRADDFSSLPPTYTFIGTEDTFFDETMFYIKKLEKSKNNIKYHIYQGGFHTFEITTPYAKISKDARANLLNAYLYATEHYFSEQK
jgi:acetyl esterase/lipase